jgi:hypothetical protein
VKTLFFEQKSTILQKWTVSSRRSAVLALFAACLLLLSEQVCHAEWAVAFGTGDGGAWANGWSSEQGSPDITASEAISRCEEHLKPCRIIAQRMNTCVAVAVATEGNGYGEANNRSMGGAKSAAMVACIRNNPAGCELKAWFCDRSGGFVEKQVAPVEQQALENALQSVEEYRGRELMDWDRSGGGGLAANWKRYRRTQYKV